MKRNDFDVKGKKILVVGLGRSGIAACRALVAKKAELYVQDSKQEDAVDPQLISFLKDAGAVCYLGRLPETVGFDMVVLSPGVSPELGFVREAKEAGAEITGELELAYRLGKGQYVGITGTNGKTTTTTLVGQIFSASGRKSHTVGNIGVAVISASVDADDDTWLITETSSFQLETTRYFRPKVSAILNLTPDHLDRHHTMEAYGAAKARIFAAQGEDDFAVINYDDEGAKSLLSHGCRARVMPFSRKEELDFGAFVKDDKIVVTDIEAGEPVEICRVDEIKILGTHNLENVLAAAAICFCAGIDAQVIGDTIRAFGGVEHRIEFCRELNGVRYYNDSKGTNVDAAVTALKALEKNIIIIAGGDGKGQDFEPFLAEFEGRVKHMILLGRDGRLIAEAADKAGFTDYSFAADMEECVNKAHSLAEPGDSVLLSPACASWDMYKNFEVRGEHFKECVNGL